MEFLLEVCLHSSLQLEEERDVFIGHLKQHWCKITDNQTHLELEMSDATEHKATLGDLEVD